MFQKVDLKYAQHHVSPGLQAATTTSLLGLNGLLLGVATLWHIAAHERDARVCSSACISQKKHQIICSITVMNGEKQPFGSRERSIRKQAAHLRRVALLWVPLLRRVTLLGIASWRTAWVS